MKRWWFGEKKHIDEQKKEQRKASRRHIRELIEIGDEVAYVAYLRKIKPGITAKEMDEYVRLFYAEREQYLRHGGYSS